MGSDLAILACGGALPVQISEAYPNAKCLSLKGIPHFLGDRTEEHQIEKLGGLFDAMKEARISRVVFAGGLTRPELSPDEMDPVTRSLAPRLMAAMQGGDDYALGQVIEIFEEQGFAVVGAHELLPELTAEDGLQIGTVPSETDLRDAARGWDILNALSPLDVGQGCVMAGGQCLGIETVQGTDFLLKSVTVTPEAVRGTGGVYIKAAKRGQDLRVDMPAIGPKTVAAVAAAGLSGMVIETGRVMIVDRKNALEAVEKAGIFLTSRVM
jgi:DUF1009 family protein